MTMSANIILTPCGLQAIIAPAHQENGRSGKDLAISTEASEVNEVLLGDRSEIAVSYEKYRSQCVKIGLLPDGSRCIIYISCGKAGLNISRHISRHNSANGNRLHFDQFLA